MHVAYGRTTPYVVSWTGRWLVRLFGALYSRLHQSPALPKTRIMANPANTVSPGQTRKALPKLPRDVAVNVSSFLELAPGLRNTPANLAKLQRILQEGRRGRRVSCSVAKGYWKKFGKVTARVSFKHSRWVFALYRSDKCQHGHSHVLIEQEKPPKDFLQGLLWLQERVSAVRKFGFCRKCKQELPEIEMYCAKCVVTCALEAGNNAD